MTNHVARQIVDLEDRIQNLNDLKFGNFNHISVQFLTDVNTQRNDNLSFDNEDAKWLFAYAAAQIDERIADLQNQLNSLRI